MTDPVQNVYWEVDSRSAGQEIPAGLNSNIHYRVHKGPHLWVRVIHCTASSDF
jgi:hypothetical protein